MSTFHLVIPVREVLDHREDAWLAGYGIHVEAGTAGRYPTWAEIEVILRHIEVAVVWLFSEGQEMSFELIDASTQESATLEVAFPVRARVCAEEAVRITFRGQPQLVRHLLDKLEPVCGGPFLIVLDGETPTL